MATTSQTYSSNSLIPTSTLASSSSMQTDDPNDDLFSSSSSPPLIVAFLAIGLFVVATVSAFGWRHLSRSRGPGNQPIRPNRRRRSISLGKKPMLWDVWADPKVPEKSTVEATRWEYMTVRLFVRFRTGRERLISGRGGVLAHDSNLDFSDSECTTTAC